MKRIDVQLRKCERCRKLMPRKRRSYGLEKPKAYARRRFCGTVCRDRAAAKHLRFRHCRHCDAPMRPSARPGWMKGYESPANFAQRVFCDDECRQLYREEHRVEWIARCLEVQRRRRRTSQRKAA